MAKFNIESLKSIAVKEDTKLFKNNSINFFKDTRAVAKALAEAIMDGDASAFHEIFSGFLSVINKEELARKSKIPISTIRRMAAGENFNVDTMLKVTNAISKSKAA